MIETIEWVACAERRPDGWQLVPVEPTGRMVDAGREAMQRAPDLGGIVSANTAEVMDSYRAMLAAAPAVPQAEPKREPLSDESPKVEWLSTDDAETQLALAIRDAVKVAPSGDDKALLYALNRRGIWLAWIGVSDAE